MDLAHSKTMESAVSEVYNIPDSKSTDLIQPPPRANEGQNGGGNSGAMENGQQKGELKKLIPPLTISNACFSYPEISGSCPSDLTISCISIPGSEFRVYARRWIVLAIFCLYSASNSMQWIQYSIIANVVQKWVNEFPKCLEGMSLRWTTSTLPLPMIIKSRAREMNRELRLGSKRQAPRRRRVKVTVEFSVALKEILVKLSISWRISAEG